MWRVIATRILQFKWLFLTSHGDLQKKKDKFKALKYSLIHGQERASTTSLKQFLCSYRAGAAKNKIPHLIMGLQNYKIN